MSDDGRQRPTPGSSSRPSTGPTTSAASIPNETSAVPASRRSRGACYPTMYRGRLWTMRQYAGMGTAEETNERFRYLLEHGQTGLSVAFDLPTQMGLDSDHPRAEGEVGKTGVAIDSIDDMRRLLDAIPLERVSTSMTINATAPILLLLYELVAEERGIEASTLSGTVQNDLLKEYAARGTYIYPPTPSMRLITDLFAYCGERIPRWNTISISGYHMREAGATAVQEVAFTLANGIAYVQAALDAGLAVDEFAPRLSFFFACHMNFFEEVAKFRAARRMWARDHGGAVRRDGPEEPHAAVPHADGRRDAHRAAAREQRRAHRARGARGGARRDAVAAHELVRRGARAADRARGQDRPADPAGDRPRDRRDATWPIRSAARTSSSRSPTRSRSGASGYLERIDAHGRRRGRDRGRLLPGRDPRGRVPDPARASSPASASSSA